MVGRTISHYKVLSEVGRGGMGVVYKAEDTNLKRPVALKFLASHLLDDEEIKARFHREAEAAAALNHPNVCTVHEIAEANGRTFIAMAFLEGEPLEKKIEAGPLKLKDALDIAIQTAKGLQAAHGKKIVHRDIKPANLMIGEDGHVTIMDFGLALLTDRSKLTRLDETMGTVTYMSPEQTYGMELDHRTDVWSLGVVIYEMVTGQRPFKGHYDKAVMYSITNEEPEPITAVRTGVPMELEVFVGKCLEKDAANRYSSAGDLQVDLSNLAERVKSGRSKVLTALQPSEARAAETRPDSPVWPLLFGVTALALAALVFVHFTQPEPPYPVRRFVIESANVQSKGLSTSYPAISPDGEHIVFAIGGEDGGLWIRDLAQPLPRPIEDTSSGTNPFWSPDSQSIGFFVGRDLKRVNLQDGQSVRICERPAGSHWDGGTWRPDGETIVFSADHKLWEVSARGGPPSLILEPESQDEPPRFEWPRFLPSEGGARVLMFQRVGGGAGSESEDGNVMIVQDLETGDSATLGPGRNPFYSPSGHILYGSGGEIWALPFSPANLRATGEAFPVAQDSNNASVSSDGTLVAISLAFDTTEQLIWRDRQGNKVGEIGRPQRRIGLLDLSPDGLRVAAEGRETPGEPEEVWVHEVDRPVSRQLTFDPAPDERPVWSPDGETLAFTRGRGGRRSVFLQRADGGGEAILLEIPLQNGGRLDYVSDWFPDGRRLLDRVSGLEDGSDLWLLAWVRTADRMRRGRSLRRGSGTSADRFRPTGGTWLTYQANPRLGTSS